MIDFGVFTLGVGVGALAILVPWIRGPFKKYVVNCTKAACPHHGPDNTKRIQDINDQTRNGPTRPDIR